MQNYLKVKKGKIIFSFLLIFNQLLLSSYAFNNRKIDLKEFEESNFTEKYDRELRTLISNETETKNNFLKQDFNDIEKFVEETFNQRNYDSLKIEQEKNPTFNTEVNSVGEENINSETKNNKSRKQKTIYINQSKKTNIISNKKNINQKNINKLLLPTRSTISTSEFKVPPRGYVNLLGPKISLNLKGADSIETLKLIAKLGDYGILIIEENNSNEKSNDNPKITANFEDVEISDAFNSVLLSANLQAVVEDNIIYVGNNIINKSLKPKVSKTYRLNQVNAASVADYLSTLGANISKVMLIVALLMDRKLETVCLIKRNLRMKLLIHMELRKVHYME